MTTLSCPCPPSGESPSSARAHGTESRHAELRVGGARVCIVVPAYDAARTLAAVIDELHETFPEARREDVFVVDDGSTDDTSEVARGRGARVLRSPRNAGKGAALVRGFKAALALGYDVALTVDADGQHPASSARALLSVSGDPRALVLGVRNLPRDGAPRANQFSNGISNYFLSRFTSRDLCDTQCGLRRYPIRETLELRTQAKGYAFEAEVLLRASAAGIPFVQEEVPVRYPPEGRRITHFDSVRDPVRIIAAVLSTLRDLSVRRKHRKKTARAVLPDEHG